MHETIDKASEHIPIAQRHQSKRYCAGSEYRKSPLWCLFFVKRLDKRIIVWYTDSVMRKILGYILMILGVLFILHLLSLYWLFTVLF